MTTSSVAVFNLKIKERKTDVKTRLAEIAAEEVEQLAIVAKVEMTINKKKVEIAKVAEQIVALQEQMSQLNRECSDLEGISATCQHTLNSIRGNRDSLQAH